MKSDLHGYTLIEAKLEIILNLKECQVKGDKEIMIIHGYKNGHVLKNYFRSNQFTKEMEQEGYKLNLKKMNKNPGMTVFQIIPTKNCEDLSNKNIPNSISKMEGKRYILIENLPGISNFPNLKILRRIFEEGKKIGCIFEGGYVIGTNKMIEKLSIKINAN